jgi:hypothetical protein
MIMPRRSTLCLLVLTFSFLGCGSDDTPPLGTVKGTIKLDGVPLEGVIVLFKPDQGRAATGTTNAQGEYTLEFSYGVDGCKVGPNTVSLEWPLGATNAKALPQRYTMNSELKADVKKGPNTFDFALESDAATQGRNIVIPD